MAALSIDLLQKPVFQMTGAELLELFTQLAEKKSIPKEQPIKYVHGLDGLARLLNCSKSKAQEIKNSGVIDAAVYQTGRKIVVNAEKALELIQQANS